MMSARLISLANPQEWEKVVKRLPHGPAHTHWYNAALAAGAGDEIALFEYADGADSAACPVVLRRYGNSVDIATPYGFGGFAIRGNCARLPHEFRRFAIEQGYVCGYLALHPLFPHPFVASDGLERASAIYLLDLTRSEDILLASMHESHRYELRKEFELLESIIVDTNSLSGAFRDLYAETLARVGASDTYRFSDATLRAWLSSPGALAIGLGDPPQAMVLCIYTSDIADYLINASSDRGRKHTRILLWAAMRELRRRGVRCFNLGGGVRESDTLDAFKRRFGGSSLFRPVLKQVYKHEQYMTLCRQAGAANNATGYFPPYRSL